MFRLLVLSFVGAAAGNAYGVQLSAPMSGLACESEVEGENLELGYRQLEVTAPLESEIEACADECKRLEGCAAFHVMQSHGCIDEVGPEVCVPWAECTFFSRCEAMVSDDDEALDWTSLKRPVHIPLLGRETELQSKQDADLFARVL